MLKSVNLTTLLLCSAMTASFSVEAHAGSVSEPGTTTGIPIYAVLPEGLYLSAVPDYSVRNTNPDTIFKALAPYLYYQSPVTFAGARLGAVATPVFVDVKVKDHRLHETGFYNTYIGLQATWDLGHGWGGGFRMSGWLPQGGRQALGYGTIEPRAGVTYYSPTQHFTANFIRGYPIETGNVRVAPNYVNVDLTYTRLLKKFELGAVAFGSFDTSRPFAGYQKQSQFQAGPIVGYNFGPVQVELKLTRDLYQRNYGGTERRAEMNFNIPIWTAKH